MKLKPGPRGCKGAGRPAPAGCVIAESRNAFSRTTLRPGGPGLCPGAAFVFHGSLNIAPLPADGSALPSFLPSAENSRMKFVSWNVNGVRAAHKKGLLDFMEKVGADVICLQEAKCHPGDVQPIAWPHGYEVFWNPAVKKGYSGTVMFTRQKPQNVSLGIGLKNHDGEGRVIT